MKITLIAKVFIKASSPILSFFENDPRFFAEYTLYANEYVYTIEIKDKDCNGEDLESTAFITLYPSTGELELEMYTDLGPEDYGLLGGQLLSYLSELIKKVNNGDLDSLPELANTLFEFNRRCGIFGDRK